MPLQRSRDVPEELMPPKEDRIEKVCENPRYSSDLPISRTNRPRTRNDIIERLMKYEWAQQIGVLTYMRKFQTWDALYADLEERETCNCPRNVTPITKQLTEGEKENV